MLFLLSLLITKIWRADTPDQTKNDKEFPSKATEHRSFGRGVDRRMPTSYHYSCNKNVALPSTVRGLNTVCKYQCITNRTVPWGKAFPSSVIQTGLMNSHA